MFKKTLPLLILLLAMNLTAAFPAWCDEITDQLKQGVEFYQKGEINKAMAELEFALAQMRQKKAQIMAELLPPAPDGWQAEKAASRVVAAGLLGGGLEATRGYTDARGNRVSMQIVSDSPLMQSLAQVMSNPMFAGGSGNKLIRLGGHKALLQAGDHSATLQVVMEGKALIKVEVFGAQDPAEVAMRFAEMLDMDKLEKTLR